MFLTKILKFEQNKSLFKENGEDWQIFKLLWGFLAKNIFPQQIIGFLHDFSHFGKKSLRSGGSD